MIARHVYAFLMGTGWDIPQVSVYDVHERAARAFADNVVNLDYHETVLVSANVESCLSGADLLVFATTAGSPYVRGPHTIEQDALILHLSLRDLDPEIVLGAYNVTDSTAHVLTADTSLHLAQKQVGHYEFIHAQIHELLDTRHQSAVDRPVIVSPFGLGVLDLELAQFVLRESNARGTSQVIPGFFLHDQGLRAWAEHP
jgi:ornithine cyclodeaminase